MKSLSISINPTWLCNFRCDFCYLTPEQLSNKTRTRLRVMSDRLKEIDQSVGIDYIDLYGGEITTLPKQYVDNLFKVIRRYYEGPVNVITNLSRPVHKTPYLLDDNVTLSVSWDYKCRERWEKVMDNMATCPKEIHVLLLASKCMIDWTDDELGACQWILNSLQNVQSVEIKPYSTNQSNQLHVEFSDFEEFIKRWFHMEQYLPEPRRYEFVNERLINKSLNRQKNAWSDDHVYITPNGKFGVLEFDDSDNEYFMELDNIQQYFDWADAEKNKVIANNICNTCPYLGHCLSEHLREAKDLNTSCNGFRFLLDWYKGEHDVEGDKLH